MQSMPKKTALLVFTLLTLLTLSYAFTLISFSEKPVSKKDHLHCTPQHHVCVMKTIFELEDKTSSKGIDDTELPANVKTALNAGLGWMIKAQLPEGGWGAGFHNRQDVHDPHAVIADPATTSLVAMSLLRTGNSLTTGAQTKSLTRATEFLLKMVEQWPASQPRLTTLSGTQPQRKLGNNIDAILTVQFFTTLLKQHQQHAWKTRIENALQKCIGRIEKEQDFDGGWKGGGWAPVLQSALADHALESASDAGMRVDKQVMTRSKVYQKGNFDTATNAAITGKSAGVLLYSLSSTSRSSAREAKQAKEMIEKGKRSGMLKKEDKLNEEGLVKAGATPAQAKELLTAYMINENTNKQSAREDIMEGFGSNGGEELISYLMTGESIKMQGSSNEWRQWYASMSKKIISIQKNDGSWEGHHCITSPVFCTAAAMLVLSINDDLEGSQR